MALISFSPLQDGVTGVNAAATNTPLSTIYNDYNGNITDANIAAAAAIAGSKINIASLANPYKFRAYRNAALSGGGGDVATLIVHDSENFDTNSNFSTSTGLYTAPINGFYVFFARCAVNANMQLIQYFYKNGSLYSRGSQLLLNATQGANHYDIIQLTAGDTVGNYVGKTTANAFEVGSIVFYFGGFLISGT